MRQAVSRANPKKTHARSSIPTTTRARFTGGLSSVEIKITGSPIITLDFPELPSTNESNDAKNSHRMIGSSHTKVWRETGYYTGKKAMSGIRLAADEVLIDAPVLLVWDVYRSDNARRDVTNLDIKPVIDGLVDARYFKDDSERIVRQSLVRYAGFSLKAHVKLSIYLLKECENDKSKMHV